MSKYNVTGRHFIFYCQRNECNSVSRFGLKIELFHFPLRYGNEMYECSSIWSDAAVLGKLNIFFGGGSLDYKNTREITLSPMSLSLNQCTVDEAIFGRMTMVMHKKLVEVTQARIFMTGTPLTEFLKAKLKTCIEEDPRLDNFYLAFNTEVTITIQTL